MDHWYTQKNVNLHVPKEQWLQAHTNECQPMYIPTECGLLTHNDWLIPPKYRSWKDGPPFKVSPEGLDTLKWLSTWLYQRNRHYWYRDESQPACVKTTWTTDKEINVNLHVTREHEYWHTEMNVSLYVPSMNIIHGLTCSKYEEGNMDSRHIYECQPVCNNRTWTTDTKNFKPATKKRT